MNTALPVIDLAGLQTGDPQRLAAIAAEIGAACRQVGFFYVINHGISPEMLAAVFAQSHAFFALPIGQKRAIALEDVGGNRGYSGLLHEALDPARGADFKEAFNTGLELAANDPELLAGVPFRSLNAWPDIAGFRETLIGYFEACAGLAQALHRAFAIDLGLAPDFFHDKLNRPMATLRLLHYPAADKTAPSDQLGAGEHTDYGNITLLATDSVGGLEVKTRDGAWSPAPVLQGALIVNIGDCLMRWTNDIYVSTPHRVVNRSGKERYSVAFFFDPNPEAVVTAIPTCIPDGEQPRYAPISAADYLAMRLKASHIKLKS